MRPPAVQRHIHSHTFCNEDRSSRKDRIEAAFYIALRPVPTDTVRLCCYDAHTKDGDVPERFQGNARESGVMNNLHGL